MPIREQNRIPPSSSESLKVAGTCDVCGQVYQGHPNRHAMCEGKTAAARQAVVPPPCKPWCGGVHHDVSRARWCSRKCADAGRPLNPAPEGQQGEAKASALGNGFRPVWGQGFAPPAPPAKVSEPGMAPLSSQIRRYVAKFLEGTHIGNDLNGFADDSGAIESELAEARRERTDEQAGALRLRERFGAKMNETFPMFVERLAGERDAARAEVEQLRGKLAEVEKVARRLLEEQEGVRNDYAEGRRFSLTVILKTIERLPLDTGTATDTSGEAASVDVAFAEAMRGRQYGESALSNAHGWFEAGWNARPQADAIKAAVAPHVCRCSNGPCPKCGGTGPEGEWFEGSEVECADCGAPLIVATTEPCFGSSTFESIDEEPDEEDDESGEDAPGAVGK